jgi:peptidoglycan hydrolase-like protein with peptidoglycan-binding domain
VKNKLRAAVLVAAAACGMSAPLVLAGPASAATPTCTLIALYQNHYVPASDSVSPRCLMSPGAQSQGVRQLQFSLNACYHKGLATDGIYGDNTKNALAAVQDALNIGVDGKYGPQTARAMNHQGANGHGCGRITF